MYTRPGRYAKQPGISAVLNDHDWLSIALPLWLLADRQMKMDGSWGQDAGDLEELL